jgi:hypothetical protein
MSGTVADIPRVTPVQQNSLNLAYSGLYGSEYLRLLFRTPDSFGFKLRPPLAIRFVFPFQRKRFPVRTEVPCVPVTLDPAVRVKGRARFYTGFFINKCRRGYKPTSVVIGDISRTHLLDGVISGNLQSVLDDSLGLPHVVDLKEEASQYPLTLECPVDLVRRTRFRILSFPLNDPIPGPGIQPIVFRTGLGSFRLCPDDDCRNHDGEAE